VSPKGFACPECGEQANLSTSTSSFRTDRWILRGRRCPQGHSFTTLEAAIDTLEWWELRTMLEFAKKKGKL